MRVTRSPSFWQPIVHQGRDRGQQRIRKEGDHPKSAPLLCPQPSQATSTHRENYVSPSLATLLPSPLASEHNESPAACRPARSESAACQQTSLATGPASHVSAKHATLLP